MKRCSKCSELKEHFNKKASSSDGLDSWCRDCTRASAKKSYQENREKRLQSVKAYYQDNSESKKAYARQYYLDNWDKKQKDAKGWQKANPEKWADIRRAYQHKRRALKRTTSVETIYPSKIYERDGWICGICHEPIDRNLSWPHTMTASLDHVVPLAKGGHHVPENLQASHYRCNVMKNIKVGD